MDLTCLFCIRIQLPQKNICVEPNLVFKGKPVSSAGWDFGTQAQALKKYRMLCWIEAKYWELEGSDVFLEIEPPTDFRLIEKEESACKAQISEY